MSINTEKDFMKTSKKQALPLNQDFYNMVEMLELSVLDDLTEYEQSASV